MERLEILGVGVDNYSPQEIIEKARELLLTDDQHVVATINAEFIVAAQHDPEFRQILNYADIAVADGSGLQYAARLQDKRLQRVTGVDLMFDLCQLAADNRFAVFLLGGNPGVAAAAAEKLKKLLPNLLVAGAEAGGKISDPKAFHPVTTHINQTNAKLLFVALGHGRQEKWIYYHLDQLPNVKLAMGVGGSFDYIAGTVPRAPRYLRQLGLEWLYRVWQQPWRWRRVVDAVIIFPILVIKQTVTKTWLKKS